MSPDTKAIVERLKAEGLLFRNTGTNSIKSVKVELGKFSDAFKAMSGSMEGITGTIQNQTKLQELQDERQFKLDDLDKKDQEDYVAQEAANTKNKQKLDTARLAQDLKASKERDKKDFKIFGRDGIFASTLKSTFNVLKKALFFGIVGAIGYEVLAGAIDALAPKLFGKDVNMPTLFEGFANAGTALGKLSMTDWDGFITNIKYLAQPIAQLGLGYAAVKGTAAVGSAAAGVAAQALTFSALKKMFTPGVDDVGAGISKAGLTKKLVRGGIAGLVFSGLYAAIDPVMNFIRGKDMTSDEIAKTEIPLGMQVGGLAGAATLAALFIPGGPLVMAAGGVAAFIIGGALKTLDYLKDDDMLPNKVEKVAAAVIDSNKKLEELFTIQEEAIRLGAPTQEIDKQIRELKKKIAEDKKRFKETFLESLAEEQEAITEDKATKAALLTPEGKEKFLKSKQTRGKAKRRSALELEKLYLDEIKELDENIALNQSQMDATVKFGREDMKMSVFDLGVTRYKGNIVTRDQREVFRAEDEEKRIVAARDTKWDAFIKAYPEASQYKNFTEMALASAKNNNYGLGALPSITTISNAAPVNNYITNSIGGAQNVSSLVNSYNQGTMSGGVFVAAAN